MYRSEYVGVWGVVDIGAACALRLLGLMNDDVTAAVWHCCICDENIGHVIV